MSEIDPKTNIEFEAEQNLLGVFEILLKVDKRMNPQNYAVQDDNQNA